MRFGKKTIKNIALLVTAAFMATANPSYADGIRVNKKEYNQTYEESKDDIFSKIENMNVDIPTNTISKEEMYEKLKKSKVILFAEAHTNTKNREVQIKALEAIKNPDLVVGLEAFHVNDQKHLDDYIMDKTNLEEFLTKTNYKDPSLLDALTKFGYLDLLKSLKKNKIKTLGINYEIDKETKRAIKRVRTLIDKPLLNKDEKKELEGICSREWKKYEEQGNNFFERDKLATEIIDEYVKKGKQVAIVIGALHTAENHLPYMIKTTTGIEPTIVSQTTLDLNLDGVYINNNPEQVTFEKKPSLNRFIELQKKLEEQGLTEDKALVVDNNFYVNTIHSIDDYLQYCSHFGYNTFVIQVSVEK